MTCLGWRWEEVLEEMDIPRFQALQRTWNKTPPVAMSMAAYVGWSEGQKEQKSDDEFEAFMASVPTQELRTNG